MDLEPDKVYFHEWPQRGFAVIAPARGGYPKHVVKTVLAPWMTPSGEPLPMKKASSLDPIAVVFFSDELRKQAGLGGAGIGAGIGALGGAYKGYSTSDPEGGDTMKRVLMGAGIGAAGGAAVGHGAQWAGQKALTAGGNALEEMGLRAAKGARPEIDAAMRAAPKNMAGGMWDSVRGIFKKKP